MGLRRRRPGHHVRLAIQPGHLSRTRPLLVQKNRGLVSNSRPSRCHRRHLFHLRPRRQHPAVVSNAIPLASCNCRNSGPSRPPNKVSAAKPVTALVPNTPPNPPRQTSSPPPHECRPAQRPLRPMPSHAPCRRRRHQLRQSWNVRHQPGLPQPKRLLSKSQGKLSCLTCHKPHEDARPQTPPPKPIPSAPPATPAQSIRRR